MTVTIKNLGDAVIYLGAVAAALAAIGVVARFAVLRPLKSWIREQIQPVMHETRDAANAVQAEVSPNHGHSIKDVVDRTERKVDTLGERFDDHLRNHPGGPSS